MKKKLPWLITAAVAILLIILGVIHSFSTKTKFNETAVNGNTAGNLYNRGLFCEYDGVVYFANPEDNFTLYSMPVSGGVAEKLNDDVVTYLNADEHYLYYARNNITKDTKDSETRGNTFDFLHWDSNSLCRTNHKGKKLQVLEHDPSMYAALLGNYLYYIHYDTKTASTLYKVKIDGSEREQVDSHPYYTCAAKGNTFYYNGLENDRNLYAYYTSSDTSQLLCKGDFWMPIIDGSIVYFMDPSDNYRLAKVDLNTSEKQTLTEDRIDCYNLYGSYIYYSSNNDPGLFRMKLDGSQREKIFSGACTDINVTSKYVYFRTFEEESIYYYTPTNGNVNVRAFIPKTK